MRISDWSADVCSSDLYPRDGYTMVKMGTAAAQIMQRDFVQKYPGRTQWPQGEAAMFQHWQELNEITFAKAGRLGWEPPRERRSEEHTSELQSLMRISYAVFCLKKKKHTILEA